MDEIEGLNIDINMGASIHMEELKEVLTNMIETFKEIFSGTTTTFNRATSNIKEGAKSLKEAGNSVGKAIKDSASEFEKSYSSVSREFSRFLNKPINALEKFVTQGIQDFGKSMASSLGEGATAGMSAGVSAGAGASAGAMRGAMGAEAMAGAGAVAPELMIVIIGIAVVLGILTKLVETLLETVDTLFNALLEGPMKMISAMLQVISAPIKMFGSVLAEMMMPSLEMWMQLSRVLYPLIQRFRDDYYEIYERLIEEGAGEMEAGMGASYGAIAGLMFDLFSPIVYYIDDQITEIIVGLRATLEWTLLKGFETLGNAFIGLANIFGAGIEPIKLVGDSLDDFRNEAIAKAKEETLKLREGARDAAVELGIFVGRNIGKVVDDFVNAMLDGTEKLNAEDALAESEEIPDVRDSSEELVEALDDASDRLWNWKLPEYESILGEEKEKKIYPDKPTELIISDKSKLPPGEVEHKGEVEVKVNGSDFLSDIAGYMEGVLKKLIGPSTVGGLATPKSGIMDYTGGRMF